MTLHQAPSQLRRLWWGFTLPLRLIGLVLRDPTLRVRYLRTVVLQLFAALTIASATFAAMATLVERVGAPDGIQVNARPSGIVVHKDIGKAVDKPSPDQTNDQTGPSREAKLAAWVYAVLVLLSLSEWLVIALSRDHHDQLGRSAALICNLRPEDKEEVPRIRLNLRWIWTKLKRRWRGFRVLMAALPVLLLGTILPSPFNLIGIGIGTWWAFYWLAVFVGAKSAQAWRDEGEAGPPWFIRVNQQLNERSRLLRWWLPRAYGRWWHRKSADVFAPCARFEEHPYELLGLAMMRLIGGLPLVYLCIRPLMPVAAAAIVAPEPQRVSGEDLSTPDEHDRPGPNA